MKKYWLFLAMAITALVMVIFMPFNPPIFFGLLFLAVVGEIWVIFTIIRLKKAIKAGYP